MLRTRLVVGLILAALAGGVLILDRFLHPWYPFLFLSIMGLTVLGSRELLDLLPPEHKPSRWLCIVGGILVAFANWPAYIINHYLQPEPHLSPWFFVLGAFIAVVIVSFLQEMLRYHKPGWAVHRMAMLVWIVSYLGLLPSFFVQIRFPPVFFALKDIDAHYGTVALALAIFVPKGCDIGAYLTGRVIGRTKMAPVLSPKKTWEGFAGGLVFAMAIAIGLNHLGPVLRGGDWTDLAAAGFGLTVGAFAVAGDLAESLIKRDCRAKDASQAVPGFGGVLDVVDSVIFAAPVAYLWLRFFSVLPGAGS